MTPLEQTLQTALDAMAESSRAQARQIEMLTRQNEELSARINELLSRLAWFQRRMFGRSSEKFHPDTHPSLFSEEELGAVKENWRYYSMDSKRKHRRLQKEKSKGPQG